MLDTDLSWTTDLRWSTGPSWTTFSTIFGLFPGGPRSVPRTFFINGKALQIGSRGVLSDFFLFFLEVFRKVPRSFSRTPGWFRGTFGKKWSWGQVRSRPPDSPPPPPTVTLVRVYNKKRVS